MSKELIGYLAFSKSGIKFIKPSKQRKPKTQYNFGGRDATIEKCGSQWEGVFDDDHGHTFIADRKRDVINDMKCHVNVS